jgi:hypothetical protein
MKKFLIDCSTFATFKAAVEGRWLAELPTSPSWTVSYVDGVGDTLVVDCDDDLLDAVRDGITTFDIRVSGAAGGSLSPREYYAPHHCVGVAFTSLWRLLLMAGCPLPPVSFNNAVRVSPCDHTCSTLFSIIWPLCPPPSLCATVWTPCLARAEQPLVREGALLGGRLCSVSQLGGHGRVDGTFPSVRDRLALVPACLCALGTPYLLVAVAFPVGSALPYPLPVFVFRIVGVVSGTVVPSCPPSPFTPPPSLAQRRGP